MRIETKRVKNGEPFKGSEHTQLIPPDPTEDRIQWSQIGDIGGATQDRHYLVLLDEEESPWPILRYVGSQMFISFGVHYYVHLVEIVAVVKVADLKVPTGATDRQA